MFELRCSLISGVIELKVESNLTSADTFPTQTLVSGWFWIKKNDEEIFLGPPMKHRQVLHLTFKSKWVVETDYN